MRAAENRLDPRTSRAHPVHDKLIQAEDINRDNGYLRLTVVQHQRCRGQVVMDALVPLRPVAIADQEYPFRGGNYYPGRTGFKFWRVSSSASVSPIFLRVSSGVSPRSVALEDDQPDENKCGHHQESHPDPAWIGSGIPECIQ